MNELAAATRHRCPRCGAAHAERRTPRTLLERSALALAGYHPYRCLECGRRFHDRPRQDAAAGTLVIPTAEADVPLTGRRTRGVADAGDTPLTRREVSTLVLVGTLIALAILTMVRFLWPESTAGVRIIG